jgi:SAM-dependent methyltransferase
LQFLDFEAVDCVKMIFMTGTEAANMIADLLREVSGTEHEAYLAQMRTRYIFLLERLSDSIRPGGRVLDVGAAPGLFTELMRRAGYDAVGLDMYPDKRFPPAVGPVETNLFFKMGIPVIKSDVVNEPFPIPDASFDAVMMNETIEHLTGSPLPCLCEIRRALRPDGLFFLTTPNVVSLMNRLRFLAGRNIHTPIEVLVNVPLYKLHNREYTMAEIADLLGRAGLEVIEKRHLNLGGRPGRAGLELARSLYYALTAFWPSGRSNLYVTAKPK